ncbi:MAG: ABC transporter substrate-binding protein [Rhodospirillales bacterium]|jgi:peptide/nickel transport system substrate-binding protein|nr:ABC transporter substrate-binding protein [Rhodospirillales bacterium]
MKRFFALIATAFLVASISAQAETVLRIGEGSIGRLDPHEATLVADSILMYNVYDTLVFPSLDGKSTEMKPHLAESIEVNESGTVFTVKLRPNVKFHSGNTLSSEDVKFSMNRIIELNTGFSYMFDGWVKSVDTPDPLTAVINLTNPYGTFYSALARLSIIDSKTVLAHLGKGDFGDLGDYGLDWTRKNSAGTGAYKARYHNTQERSELVKFDDYFLGIPDKAPDLVRLQYGQTDPTVIALFERGEMDIARSFIASETKKQLLSVKGVTIASEPGIAMLFMKPNVTKPPFDDVNCRKGFAYALDYEAMMLQEHVTDKIRGAIPAKSPMPSSHPGFDPTMPPIKQDMAKAKEFMAKCKYKPGSHKIQITWISTVAKEERFALIAQVNWKELGWESYVEPIVWAHWTQKVRGGAGTAPMIGQVYTFARIPDADAYLYNIFHSSRHGQYSASEFFADDQVDEMLDKARTMLPSSKRDALYAKILRRVQDLQATFTGFEVINTYPRSDRFSWPNMEKPNMNTGLMGGNHIFRLMEMKGG